MKGTIAIALGLVALVGVGGAAGQQPVPDASTLNPSAIKIVLPEKIDWRPAVGLPGADVAVLAGDASKPGFYIQLNRFKPGSFSRPHYHANDRYVMVVSGTWWVGTGAAFDPEHATVPLRAGTFAVHPGRQVHYDGARSGGEEAIVMIIGERGPGARVECEGPTAEKTPGPCFDAINAAAAKSK